MINTTSWCQYDKPGLQASVVRVEGTNKAIASTIDGEARYVYNNPYEGGKMVVAEAS